MRILSINLGNILFTAVIGTLAYVVDKYLAGGSFGSLYYVLIGLGLGIFTPMISHTYYPISSLDKNLLKEKTTEDKSNDKKD